MTTLLVILFVLAIGFHTAALVLHKINANNIKRAEASLEKIKQIINGV